MANQSSTFIFPAHILIHQSSQLKKHISLYSAEIHRWLDKTDRPKEQTDRLTERLSARQTHRQTGHLINQSGFVTSGWPQCFYSAVIPGLASMLAPTSRELNPADISKMLWADFPPIYLLYVYLPQGFPVVNSCIVRSLCADAVSSGVNERWFTSFTSPLLSDRMLNISDEFKYWPWLLISTLQQQLSVATLVSMERLNPTLVLFFLEDVEHLSILKLCSSIRKHHVL